MSALIWKQVESINLKIVVIGEDMLLLQKLSATLHCGHQLLQLFVAYSIIIVLATVCTYSRSQNKVEKRNYNSAKVR